MVKQFLFANVQRLVVCLLISILYVTDISAQGYQPKRQNTYPTRYRQNSSRYQSNGSTRREYVNPFMKQDKSSLQDQRNESTHKQYNNSSVKQEQSNNSSKADESSKKNTKSEEDAKQKSADDVELIVTGEGRTKDEATKTALRSAIEQAFGTFVSSNTDILNDNIVKDEIVTISSGNIENYQIISENEINGNWQVLVKTTVSIGKLVKYVQSKGAEAELAGATFAMNVKIKKLYKKNEEAALENLYKQLSALFLTSFDYELNVGEPRENNGLYYVPIIVTVKANKNAEACYQLYHKTLRTLSISREEEIDEHNGISWGGIICGTNEYHLRNNPYMALSPIEEEMKQCICNFTLSDGSRDFLGYYDDNKDYFRLLDSKTKNEVDWAHIRKRRGPLSIRCEGERSAEGTFLPIIANSQYAGNIIATFEFELRYNIDDLSKISSFKIRPTVTKELKQY